MINATTTASKTSARMRALGRKGGVARATTLTKRQRAAIARAGAAARWRPEPLVLDVPRDHEELQCFVAQYGNGYCTSKCDDTMGVLAVLHRAVEAARDDACLARMLPVFIWRARGHLQPGRIACVSPRAACALGYFVELAFRFSNEPPARARPAVAALRARAAPVTRPFVFFHLMDTPGLRERAAAMTSPAARAWNLILGEPDDSFESYFRKFDPRTYVGRSARAAG
jgi:hypothetical protein